MVDNFVRIQNSADGSALLTDAQRQWIHAMHEKNLVTSRQKIKSQVPPTLPSGVVRRRIFRLVNSFGFDVFMTGTTLG